MSQHLRDALLELLMLRMADYMQSGFTDNEALVLGIEEIKQQIRESRLDLAAMLISEAERDARARDRGTRLN
jgi:hypothetical protein